MTAFRRTRAALAAGLILSATPAFAQQKQIRVAVVDPSRVFNEMQETKELRTALESERQRLSATSKEKEAELENLKKQRQFLKPGTAQEEDANNQLMQKAMEYEVWSKYAKLNAERNQKKQMRALFAKIEAAAGEVARQQGIDVVITDHSPELPEAMEGISIEQLRLILNSRHVLYASDNADISGAVIALLDARFKNAASGPAPAPAPAPAPK
jgi:Skp family chaperone for outer membrane proteins